MMNAPQPARSVSPQSDGTTPATSDPVIETLSNTPTIRTLDQRVRVFVSSTLEELSAERVAAREAITQLRLIPVMFELGARPYPPRDLYRAYMAQSDVFVGIYWQRYGWVSPSMDISGLEDEEQLSAGKPRLIYLKDPAPEREPRLAAMLDRVRADEVTSYRKFSSPDELREALANDLAVLLTEYFSRSAQPAAPTPTQGPLTRLTRPARATLPFPRNRMINRTREAANTRELLLSKESGLVTLTGPGGVGKTRLALEVSADIAKEFTDGAAFLPLGSLTDSELVVSTIAQGLGVEGDARRPIDERLLETLRSQNLLLVLDNLEQIVTTTAAWVSTVIKSAPGVKVLATSREPLRVHEERVVPVPPLELPNLAAVSQSASIDIARLSEVPSVALFIERAREIQPDFALTNANAAAVAAICRRLDGLPLAIELAVARLPVLPPEALLARLEHSLPLLTRGPRDLPTRQQTLRATIAWSYDLLGEQTQTLFRQLAVFVGGSTLAAIQAVCRVGGDPELEDVEALEGIAELVDKNLLQTEDSSDVEPRFSMLETVREFALELLGVHAETISVKQRHADFFLGLVRAVQPHQYDSDRDTWFARMERDDDNLRAMLAWTTTGRADEKTVESAMRLAGVFAWYWYSRGRLQEGRSWMERLLACVPDDDQADTSPGRLSALGLAHHGLAWLTLAQGDIAAAAVESERSVAIFRELGGEYKQLLANALLVLGIVRISQGMPEAAHPILEEGLSLSREVGGAMGFIFGAYSLFQLGRAAQAAGNLADSSDFYEQSLRLFRQSGDTVAIALVTNAAAVVAAARGDDAATHIMLPENLPPARVRFSHYEVAQLLVDAGMASLQHGELQQAENLLTESLRLWNDIGTHAGIARALAGLAGCAAAKGQAEEAGRLYGVAQVLLPQSSRLLTDASGIDIDQRIATARAQLDTPAFAVGLAAGQAMTLEQATLYAREML